MTSLGQRTAIITLALRKIRLLRSSPSRPPLTQDARIYALIERLYAANRNRP